MRYSRDRLKMVVLYFLSSIIIGNAKVGDGAPLVEEIFRRAVTDLDWCKSFPWDRLSFDDTMEELKKQLDNGDGVAKPYWCFTNFIIPLELLVFEAVSDLTKKFREAVNAPSTRCPRMCKSRFTSHTMKGFSLSKLNDAFGIIKDIHSIMEPTLQEIPLMEEIMDDPFDGDDHCDAIIDGWMRTIEIEKKEVWIEELYNAYVDDRKEENQVVAKVNGRKGKEKVDGCYEDLKELMEAGLKEVGEKMTDMEIKVSRKLTDLDEKMKYVMTKLPPMDEGTSMKKEKEVGSGEPSNVKEKKKTKKRKTSYSCLVKGHFEPPKTHSRVNSNLE